MMTERGNNAGHFDTAIYKDVIKRGKIRNPVVLQELINALLKSKGSQ